MKSEDQGRLPLAWTQLQRESPFNSLAPLPPRLEVESAPILKLSAKAQVALAEIREAGAALPNQSYLVRALQVQEAKQSSEIENIVTTNDALYRSLDTEVATDSATREVLGHTDALWAGYQAIRDGKPISPSVILDIAGKVKYEGIQFRAMPGTQVVDAVSKQVRYTPPSDVTLILGLLDNLCEYMSKEDDTDPLVRLAISHYQFEAIHPLPDGNGRTGRVLNMLYLLQSKLLHVPTLYLSRPILATRAEYNRRLQAVTEDEDWKGWIQYMLEAVYSSATDALRRIRRIQQLIVDTEARARQEMKRGYSKELVELIFRLPYTRIASLESAGIAKRDTASVYLRELERIGLVDGIKVGRDVLFVNRSYLAALIE